MATFKIKLKPTAPEMEVIELVLKEAINSEKYILNSPDSTMPLTVGRYVDSISDMEDKMKKLILTGLHKKVAAKLVKYKSQYSLNLNYIEAIVFWLFVNPVCPLYRNWINKYLQSICNVIHKKITSL